MVLILPYLIYFGSLNLAIILLGYVLIRQKAVLLSWIILAVAITTIHLIFLHQGPLLRMLAIIAITFTWMKVIAVAQGYKHKIVTLKLTQWLAFAIGWAGMRAQPFETLGQKPLPNAWPMIKFGVSRVFLGFALIALAHGVVLLPLDQFVTYIIVSSILLVGLSLILHFGMLSISAGMWRLGGVNTYLLFRQPAKATSLTELWSKRWNIAFSEMTSISIYRPIKNKYGSAVALMLAFAFSGLLHELALSVPVNSDYGLPMLYFIIQGVMILIEKILSGRGILFLQNKIVAHIWVFFWLVIPMPLLFNATFIKQVVWPLAGM